MMILTRFGGHLISWDAWPLEGVHQCRTNPYQFLSRMMELVHVGRTPEELAREFEPSSQTIRNWVRQDEVDHG
jgi:transposase-like protein